MDFTEKMLHLGDETRTDRGNIWNAMVADHVVGDDPRLGGTWTLVPPLGETIWQWPLEIPEFAPFSAFIYRLDDRRKIGMVRIPHYIYDRKVVEDFEKLVTHLESETEALVIDQTRHLGGSLFQMYAMLSYLTDRPLTVPTHEVTIFDEDLELAREMIALAEAGHSKTSEFESQELAYNRLIVSEFESGRGRGSVTKPLYLEGVSEILPAKSHYSKKIVVTIDELTFSAGEFLAAILQDNRRALLFGHTTAGAGGCARRIAVNRLGVEYYTITWTVATRTNGEQIQRIGVSPDINYVLTVEDLQASKDMQFQGYRRALLAAIDSNTL